ncbi:hypothetical protein HYC85_009349 [Camellia sinensis]|uniref:Uncharacterized protein n=1 Tax=Camellia sinensis TaxID=4442 RepID=A0A7J7HFL6_CAMSI|nr:hypothetical protein HYC85_009349 [Camellia sinensis]
MKGINIGQRRKEARRRRRVDPTEPRPKLGLRKKMPQISRSLSRFSLVLFSLAHFHSSLSPDSSLSLSLSSADLIHAHRRCCLLIIASDRQLQWWKRMAVVVLVEEKNKRRDLKDFELIKARSEGFKEHLIQIWGFRIRYVGKLLRILPFSRHKLTATAASSALGSKRH